MSKYLGLGKSALNRGPTLAEVKGKETAEGLGKGAAGSPEAVAKGAGAGAEAAGNTPEAAAEAEEEKGREARGKETASDTPDPVA